MTDNVLMFPVGHITKGDIPAEKVLAGAIKADLETVIVIGTSAKGERYYASSTGDAPMLSWLTHEFISNLHRASMPIIMERGND